MTDSAPATTLQDAQEDLGDLLLEVLPPDGSKMGNQAAREALSRVAERQVGEQEYEAIRDKALALGLVARGTYRPQGGPGRQQQLRPGIGLEVTPELPTTEKRIYSSEGGKSLSSRLEIIRL